MSTPGTALTPATASISDALDRLGLPGSLHGIRSLRAGQQVHGLAFTVADESVDDAGGTVGDFLDDVPAGAVVVIDNEARTDCTVWGGIMSRIALERGVAGTVINGTCRDTATVAEAGYPLWSVSTFMRTGKDRVRVTSVGEPVVIDGVTVAPGDILVADDDGAVAVPASRWDQVLRIAERIEAVEDEIVASVQAGATLREARAQHGYHSLQTRES